MNQTKLDERQLNISGTPTGSKFLKDDFSWAIPAGDSLEVTDGITDVTSVTKLTASTGLAVAAGGTGEAILTVVGGGLVFTEYVLGATYSLTNSYAVVEPAGGAPVQFIIPANTPTQVSINLDITNGSTANDVIKAKLYNLTASADVAGTERVVSNLVASGQGELILTCSLNPVVDTTIQVWAENATAARGAIN